MTPHRAARMWVERLDASDATALATAVADSPGLDDIAEPSSIVSPRGVLLRVNPAFTREFGWDNRDVVGLQAADLLVPELRSWAEHRLEEITGAPLLPRPSAPRIRHRDGHAVQVSASSVPVRDEAGQTLYIVSTVVPVGEPTDESGLS